MSDTRADACANGSANACPDAITDARAHDGADAVADARAHRRADSVTDAAPHAVADACAGGLCAERIWALGLVLQDVWRRHADAIS